jgi:hypothetical protein
LRRRWTVCRRRSSTGKTLLRSPYSIRRGQISVPARRGYRTRPAACAALNSGPERDPGSLQPLMRGLVCRRTDQRRDSPAIYSRGQKSAPECGLTCRSLWRQTRAQPTQAALRSVGARPYGRKSPYRVASRCAWNVHLARFMVCSLRT